jgi:hypothetical protein
MKLAPGRMDHFPLYALDQPGLRQVCMLTLPYRVAILATLVQIDITSIQKHLVISRNHGYVTKPTQRIHLHIHFLDFIYLERAKI